MATVLGLALWPRALETGPGPLAGEMVAMTATILQYPKMESCKAWSPHEAGRKKQGRGEIAVPVQCNRPAGHPGNHMCLAGSFERLAEWTPAEVIK